MYSSIFSSSHPMNKEPRTLQLMELQTPQQPELQQQQPTEEGGSTQAAGSSSNPLIRPTLVRWAPTPPQLRILQGLYYDKGFKYPTPEQIQEISLNLKQFGPIEDKNVFFWFQNLKARERQQMRPIREVPVGGSLDLNFGPIRSTDDGRSIDLHFGSTDPTGGQTSLQQRGGDHQEVETLPLFPVHGEDVFGNPKPTSEEGSAFGYYSGGSGGYNRASNVSLELSLNSFDVVDLD